MLENIKIISFLYPDLNILFRFGSLSTEYQMFVWKSTLKFIIAFL